MTSLLIPHMNVMSISFLLLLMLMLLSLIFILLNTNTITLCHPTEISVYIIQDIFLSFLCELDIFFLFFHLYCNCNQQYKEENSILKLDLFNHLYIKSDSYGSMPSKQYQMVIDMLLLPLITAHGFLL